MQITRPNVLVVEARDEVRAAIRRALEAAEFEVHDVDRVNTGLGWLNGGQPACVILSLQANAPHPVTDVKILRQAAHGKLLLVLGEVDEDTLIDSLLGAGADSYISGLTNYGDLVPRLSRLLEGHDREGDIPFLGEDRAQYGAYTVVRPLDNRGPAKRFLVERKGLKYELYTLQHHGQSEDELSDLNQRFLRGALVASNIEHPHLMRIMDIELGDHRTPAYFVTDHLEGEPLRDYCVHHPDLSFRERAVLVRQVADALGALHEQHVTIRALPPEAIIVTPGGTAKIIDLYSAHVPSSHLTLHGEVIGIPAYEAPECAHTSDIGPVADVFSLGTLAYELFTGRCAFSGHSVGEVVHDVRHGRPKRPCKIATDLPRALEDIVAKMLHKDPTDRYQSMSDVMKDLDAFLNDEKPPIASHHGFTEALFERVWE